MRRGSQNQGPDPGILTPPGSPSTVANGVCGLTQREPTGEGTAARWALRLLLRPCQVQTPIASCPLPSTVLSPVAAAAWLMVDFSGLEWQRVSQRNEGVSS